jgi:jouberin
MERREREAGIDSSEADFKASLTRMIPEIRVLSTSRLELDPNVGHPFVRVHLVDKRSGVYWGKKVDDRAIYHWENIVKFNKDLNAFKAYETDILVSMATGNCDFRLEGNSFCEWNEVIKLNFPAADFFSPDLIILFELLDFNHKMLVARDHSRLRRDLTYPVAWAYLRPMGIAKRHVGPSKLQLYRY